MEKIVIWNYFKSNHEISNQIQIKSHVFQIKSLFFKSNHYVWFNHDLNQIMIWICPSMAITLQWLHHHFQSLSNAGNRQAIHTDPLGGLSGFGLRHSRYITKWKRFFRFSVHKIHFRIYTPRVRLGGKGKSEGGNNARGNRQWRRLHGARAPHFYKWLGTGGTVSRTANKKLTKLYWQPRKRSPKRLIVLLEPKSGGARPKKFFRCPHFCFGPVPPTFKFVTASLYAIANISSCACPSAVCTTGTHQHGWLIREGVWVSSRISG